MATEFCKKDRNAARIIIPDIKEALEKPIITDIDMNFIKNRLGGEFAKKYSFTLYWGLKCGLFKEGYYADSLINDRIKVRRKKIDDKLPDSLDIKCDC